jgi:hypothetical protein
MDTDETLDKPGTTAGQTGDAAQPPTTETAPEAGREAGVEDESAPQRGERTDWKAIVLGSLKPMAEKLNAIEARMGQNGPVTTTSPTVEPTQPPAADVAALQRSIFELEQAERDGVARPEQILALGLLRDRMAQESQRGRDAAENQRQRTLDKIESDLNGIGDESERDETREYLKSHWGEVTTVRAARAALRGEKSLKEPPPKPRSEGGEPAKKVITTYQRDLPQDEAQATRMTGSAIEAKLEELTRARDTKGLIAFQNKLIRRQIIETTG